MKKTGFYKRCKTCGKKVHVPLWLYKYKKNKKLFYCNKECMLNRPSVFHKCKTCSKIFRRTEGITKRSKYGLLYCSRKCRYLDPESFDAIRTGKFMNCKTCGKKIYTIPSTNLKFKNRYCSVKCRSLDEDYRILMTIPRIKRRLTKCHICGKEVLKHRYQFKRSKSFFCSKDCLIEYLKYNRVNFVKPNKIEKKFILLIKKYKLPYKYVGDGSFWIENVNPDFINNNGKKEVIEIFGDYWHNPKINKNCRYNCTEKGRKQIFKKYGFNCIILWEKEFSKKDWEENILRILGVESDI